jgi:HEAT repeat protein
MIREAPLMHPTHPSFTALFVAVLLGTSAAASSLAASTSSSSSSSASAVSSSSSWPTLRGLQPGFYLQKRNHAPDVTADLRALPARDRVDVALALLSASDDALPLADDDAYPAGLSAKARTRLRMLERRAARTGALVVLADAEDARALPALVRTLDHQDVRVAAVAAERLGQREDGAVVDLLSRVAQDSARDATVRAGACAGLGHHRTRDAEAALDALLALSVDKGTPAVVVVAALHAMANLGSSWAWQAQGDTARGAALRKKARGVLHHLDGTGDVAAARDAVLSRLH